jgi:putative transposase
MTHSLDIRRRVVLFVKNGGSKAEAARRYDVTRSCVYDWLSRDDLKPKIHGRRQRKLNWEQLRLHVDAHPEALLRERAAHFGVRISSIEYAMKQMRISHKKNAPLS